MLSCAKGSIRLEVMDRYGIFFGAMMLLWASYVGIELYTGKTELSIIVVGFIFFHLCNATLEYTLKNRCFKLLHNVPIASFDIFINTSISLVHSLILSCSVGTGLILEYFNNGVIKMLEFESLYYHPWRGAYSILAFSCGYFAYDQVDMIRRHLYKGSLPPLLVHHMILLNCFTLALVRGVSINYLILTLLCEMHSVFLHWRKVGRMAGIRKLVNIEWCLNWVTFFTTRFFVHIGISLKLYIDARRFPSIFELVLASSGMLSLNILNFLLGVDLYRAFQKELKQA